MERSFLDKREFARLQRRLASNPESALWQCLRNRRVGFKFARQVPIGPYFTDFCCRSRKLVVEVDGECHLRRPEEDEARDRFLREAGYVVLRVTVEQFQADVEGVIEEIRFACASRPEWRF